MAYYHVHGLIPDTLAQSEGYQLFEQYIANGAPKDNFDGFKLISRVHAPQTREVFVTCSTFSLKKTGWESCLRLIGATGFEPAT